MRLVSLLIVASFFGFYSSSVNAAIETFAQTVLEWTLQNTGTPGNTPRSETKNDGSSAFSEQVKSYGVARTEADFGTLKIYGESIRQPTSGTVSGRSAGGTAYYIDEFVINGGTGTGTASVGMLVTGGRFATADNFLGSTAASLTVQAYFDPNGANVAVIDGSPPNASFSYNGTGASIPILVYEGVSGSFNFTYGVPFEMKMQLSARAHVDPFGATGIPPNELQTLSILDLSNTATTYFDLPAGAVLAPTSGAAYLLGPVPIPLPAPLVLLASALAWLFVLPRRWKRVSL